MWHNIKHHFLMQVTYQTDLFLDKNIDYAVNEHQVLLHASRCSFVSSIFPPSEESAKSTKFTSIGSSFKVKQNVACPVFYSFVVRKLIVSDNITATITSFAGNSECNRATLHPLHKAQ
jgi:hypothetical protein